MKAAVTAFVFMEHSYDPKTHQYSWAPAVWMWRVDETVNRVFICEQTVTVEVPEKFNPVPAQVAALEREKAEALEKYQQSVAKINERLAKLQAIGNEVGA